MGLASTTHKKKIKEFLEDPSTFGTVLLTIILDNYTTEALDWDTSSLIQELKEDFDAEMPQVNFDKLNAMIVAVTTDSFYEDWVAFSALCAALNSDPFDMDILDIPTPEQMAWAITEVSLSEDPNARPLFNENVKRYQGVTLEFYGMSRPPDIMQETIMPKGVDGGIESLKTDPIMYKGFYNKQQDDISSINQYIKENLASLVKQLDEVPLQNKDSETWETFKNRSKSLVSS